MLARLGTFLHARGRLVLAIGVLAAVIAGVFGVGVSKSLWPYDAKDPATQSVQAAKRFESAAGRQIDPGIVALIKSGDVRTRAARRRVAEVVSELERQPHVALVQSFYSSHDPAMISRSGDATYVVAYFKPLSNKTLKDVAQQIEGQFTGQHDVVLGGSAVANAQVNNKVSKDLARAELFAFPFIFLLSLLFFRSLVAALLPPLLGGLAIVITFFVLRIVGSVVDISVYALNFTTGMGLGLAIDYSLFMVSRYREEAARTGFGTEALIRTLQTAGRTIIFSSSTIAVAVASLILFPQNFLHSMGIAGAIVALLAATLALTVLPALLAVLGPRINSLAPKRLQLAAEREARPAEHGAWYRISRFVMRRPSVIAIASAAVLIAVGIPFAGIKLIQAGSRVLPLGTSARQVSDALDTEFPPHRTTPLEVVVGAPARSPQVRSLAARISGLPDVAAVAPAQPAGSYSLLAVAPTQSPLSSATQQLVKRVRAIHEPFYVGVGVDNINTVGLSCYKEDVTLEGFSSP